MADLSKLRFNGTDYNVKDASAPTRKFNNAYSKTGNLPITSDDTTQTAIGKLENNIIPKSAKGTANGVAELDANGKVPSSQLPSYVDDVLEYSAKSSFPATGESGKIYVDTTTNKTYRWSGSAYVEISESLALGETDSTAYRGDRGKTAYGHSQLTSGNPHNVTKSDVGLGNVGNFKAVSTAASQGLSDTEKSNARANIGAGTGNGTYSKPSGGIPKSDLATAVQTSLNQVATNQTNILYSLQNGVKNLFNLEADEKWSYSLRSQTVDTKTGTLSITSNSDWARVGIPITLPAGKYVISGNVTSLVGNALLMGNTEKNDTGTAVFTNIKITTTGAFTANFTLNSATTFWVILYANYSESVVSNSVTITGMMICAKESWDQEPNVFRPFALPNYDLTRLEAEDRAALADVVDTGNKNLIKVDLDYIASANKTLTWNDNVGTTSDGHITFTVDQTDGTIRVQSDGSNAQTQFFIIGESISPYFTIDERYVISGCPSGGSETKYDLRAWSGSVYYIDRGNSFAFTCRLTRLKVDIVIRANQTLDLTFKPMICKEIDWNVSNKLVPGELTGGLKPVYRYNSSEVSKAFSYTIKRDDFITDGICTTSCGTYIVSVINCSSAPSFSLYAISFSGGVTSYVNVTKIAGEDLTITVAESTFSFSTTGTVRIYALV